MTPNNVARATDTLVGKYLFAWRIDNIGKGKRRRRKAIVEKDEPVGVKVTDFAKSNGRKICLD